MGKRQASKNATVERSWGLGEARGSGGVLWDSRGLPEEAQSARLRFGQAWGLQGEEKTEYWGQSRPRMEHRGY